MGNRVEKKRFDVKEIFNLKSLLSFSLLLGIEVIVFLIVYVLNDYINVSAVNGTFAAGCVGVAIAGLTFAANDGTFDVFPVGFQNLISVARKDGRKKYDGLFEYRQIKATRRKSRRFIPLWYLLDGIIFILISVILNFTII